MLMFAFDNAYQVLVQGIPPQSPINGFMTPQGHVVRHQKNRFFFEQEQPKLKTKYLAGQISAQRQSPDQHAFRRQGRG